VGDLPVSFITNLIGVKTDQAVSGLITTIVQWDPQSATEAELRTMEDNLDQLGRQVAAARIGFEKEKREADAIQLLANQRLAAANQLQAELEQTNFNAPKKAEMERSLTTLVNMLEEMAPDVDREKQDATDAAEFLQMLQTTYEDAAGKLRNARSELDRAQRDMGRAEQQREMAERRAQASRQAAGLSGATSGLTVALKAMQDTAQRNLVEAEAANQKARLLAPTTPEKDDPNIALAMARVRGQIPPETTTLANRLETLRMRQIGRS
jgi:chromosome segregation ATPase